MKETPASLAEQILRAIDPVLLMPLTESRETELVNAILTVINPLCNEVAKLEAELEESIGETVKCDDAWQATDAKLHTLTRLATAVVEAWDDERSHSELGVPLGNILNALDALSAHIRNGGTGS